MFFDSISSVTATEQFYTDLLCCKLYLFSMCPINIHPCSWDFKCGSTGQLFSPRILCLIVQHESMPSTMHRIRNYCMLIFCLQGEVLQTIDFSGFVYRFILSPLVLKKDGWVAALFIKYNFNINIMCFSNFKLALSNVNDILSLKNKKQSLIAKES